MDSAILRLPQVLELVGLSRSWVYEAMKEGRFPLSIPLSGARAKGWVKAEIIEWIEGRIKARSDGQDQHTKGAV